MFELVESKKPILLFRGLINGQLVALAPEPFALRLNATATPLPKIEQWEFNIDSGMYEKFFIGGDNGAHFAAMDEEFFDWDEEMVAWVASPLKKRLYLIESDPALAQIVALYGPDMGAIEASDISGLLNGMVECHWEEGQCTKEEVFAALENNVSFLMLPKWMQEICIASMNASREASSALWDVIESRYPD